MLLEFFVDRIFYTQWERWTIMERNPGIAELYSALKPTKSRVQLGDPRGGILGGIFRISMRRS
jgi:hypothetical protein